MKKIAYFLSFIVVFSACQEAKKSKKFVQAQADEDYLVSISTPYGEMKAILYEKTPFHKKNFLKLAYQGFYDGLLFHRVIKDFMIQGGDPDSKNALPETFLGQGSNGYTIPAEIREEFFHQKGALAAARLPNPTNRHKASNGCQFYVVQGKKLNEQDILKARTDFVGLNQLFPELLKKPNYQGIVQLYAKLQEENRIEDMQQVVWKSKDLVEKEFGVELDLPLSQEQKKTYLKNGGSPSLDGEYTVFGQVVSGLDVLDKIANLPVSQSERPTEDVSMEIKVEILKKSVITQKYGIIY